MTATYFLIEWAGSRNCSLEISDLSGGRWKYMKILKLNFKKNSLCERQRLWVWGWSCLNIPRGAFSSFWKSEINGNKILLFSLFGFVGLGFFFFYCSKFQNALLPMRRISEYAQVSDGWIRNFWNKVDWVPKIQISQKSDLSPKGYITGKSEKYVY